MPEISKELMSELPFYLQAELAENVYRKAFSQEEIAEFQLKIRDVLSPKFGRHKQARLEDLDAGTTDELIGRIFGESRETVRERREVFEAAKSNPEYESLLDEMNRTGKVAPSYKRLKNKQDNISFERLSFKLPGSHATTVTNAIYKTGLTSADALVAICQYYLDHAESVPDAPASN